MEAYEELTGSLLDVWTYTPLVLTVIGTTGNVLSVITFCSRRCRKSSFTVYLGALAITDSICLITALVHTWLFRVFRPDLGHYGTASCKIIVSFTYFFSQVSSWLVVTVTVERSLCSFYIQFYRKTKSVRFGFVTVGILVTVLAIFNSHIPYGITYSYYNNNTFCGFVNDSYANFFVTYYLWFDTTIYFGIPIIIIIIGNSATVIKVYKTQRAVTRTTSIGLLIANQMTRKSRNVLIITLMVSVSFIVCLSPPTLFFALKPLIYNKDQFQQSFEEQVAECVVYMLYCLNCSINFYLYMLSGSRFRRDLKAAICLRFKQGPVITSIGLSATLRSSIRTTSA